MMLIDVSLSLLLSLFLSHTHAHTHTHTGHVTVSVRDSGTGIMPENISRLFQEGVQFNANELQVSTLLHHRPASCITRATV
jgi:sensor histidine kinase regulating citrate/malate metabolism